MPYRTGAGALMPGRWRSVDDARALAADYPSKPIKLLVPYAGRRADAVARVVAQHVGDRARPVGRGRESRRRRDR